jgi:glycosyltransferase involved in cell wall biosynthesis
MSQPIVSIGLPVYNGEDYIEKCLSSIVAQTYENLEIIVSDNRSTDATFEICKRFAREDDRVRLLRNEKNLGAVPNMNKVVEAAGGKYFHWIGHDDYLRPEFVTQCVRALEADNSVVTAYSKSDVVDERNSRIHEKRQVDFNLDAPQPSRRWRRFFERWYPEGGLVDVFFGVTRLEALRKTRLLKDYPSNDVILFAELALYGKFTRVADGLFVRRDHPDRSYRRRNISIYEWLSADHDDQVVHLTRLNHLMDHFRSVRRRGLGRADRLSCYQTILACFLRHYYYDILSEIKEYALSRGATHGR